MSPENDIPCRYENAICANICPMQDITRGRIRRIMREKGISREKAIGRLEEMRSEARKPDSPEYKFRKKMCIIPEIQE